MSILGTTAGRIGGTLAFTTAGGIIGGAKGALKGSSRGTEDVPEGGFYGAASGGLAGAVKGAAMGLGISMIPGFQKGVFRGLKGTSASIQRHGLLGLEEKGMQGLTDSALDMGNRVTNAFSTMYGEYNFKGGSALGNAVRGTHMLGQGAGMAVGGAARWAGSAVAAPFKGIRNKWNEGKNAHLEMAAKDKFYAKQTSGFAPWNIAFGLGIGGALGGMAINASVVGSASVSGEGHPYNAITGRKQRRATQQGEFMMNQSNLAREQRLVMRNPSMAGMRDVNEAYSYSRSNRASAMPLSAGHSRVAGPQRRFRYQDYDADGELVFALNDLRRR